MGDIIHQSAITITRVKGPTRKAVIQGFDQPVYYGVHGGIKNFFILFNIKGMIAGLQGYGIGHEICS